MSKFTKGAAIDDITNRAKQLQEFHRIDPTHGSSQLWPRGCDERTKEIISRAIGYGAMTALNGVATDIAGGYIGVKK